MRAHIGYDQSSVKTHLFQVVHCHLDLLLIFLTFSQLHVDLAPELIQQTVKISGRKHAWEERGSRKEEEDQDLRMVCKASATVVSGRRTCCLRLGWRRGRHRFHWVTHPAWITLGLPTRTAFFRASSHLLMACCRICSTETNHESESSS